MAREYSQNLKNFLTLIQLNDFLVLDTETTGLHDGEICQITIINNAGKVELDSFVKTVYPIPVDAGRIHGITDSMVAEAPDWKTLIPTIQQIVQGRDLVVYNATYDRKMFHRSGEAHSLPKTEWREIARWHCAMEAYAEFFGEWNSYHGNYRWQSLSNACHQQQLEISNAHTALGDCLMTLALCNAMLQAVLS